MTDLLIAPDRVARYSVHMATTHTTVPKEDTAMQTKISGLNAMQTSAVALIKPSKANLTIDTTATTATFGCDALAALQLVKVERAARKAVNAQGTEGYRVLDAVIRKLEQAADQLAADLGGERSQPEAKPEATISAVPPAKPAKATKKASKPAPAPAAKADNGTRANPATLPVGWAYGSKARAAGGTLVVVTKRADNRWEVTCAHGTSKDFTSRSAAYVAMRTPQDSLECKGCAKAAKAQAA